PLSGAAAILIGQAVDPRWGEIFLVVDKIRALKQIQGADNRRSNNHYPGKAAFFHVASNLSQQKGIYLPHSKHKSRDPSSGEGKPDRGSFSHSALDADRPPMKCCYALDDGESQTGISRPGAPSRVSAIKAVEDMRKMVFGDAAAIVGDAHT